MPIRRSKSKMKKSFDWQECRSALPFLMNGLCIPGPFQIFNSEEERRFLYEKWKKAYNAGELPWQKEAQNASKTE